MFDQGRHRRLQNPERAVRPSLRPTEPHMDARQPNSGECGQLAGVPNATVRRRDVRRGDANRRHVGPGRSSRMPVVGQPAGRAHPCRARAAFVTRDSRQGSAAGSARVFPPARPRIESPCGVRTDLDRNHQLKRPARSESGTAGTLDSGRLGTPMTGWLTHELAPLVPRAGEP